MWSYPILDPVSQAYPEVQGRSPTCYSPVRHSSTSASTGLSVRLACVKHAASVHPEPGSNSPQKTFQQKQAVKSPIPNQKQTNQHPNRRRTGKNPKITRFNNRPQPDGVIKQGRSKNIRETCSTTPHAHYEPKDDAIHHWNSTTPPPAHTQTQGAHHTVHKKAGKHTHATKVHWHTIEFSNNTSTPNTNPHTVSQHQSDFGIRQRLFSCPPHKPERISPSSGALSVSLTRYKLHTPHTQHKPAAHRPFFTCS